MVKKLLLLTLAAGLVAAGSGAALAQDLTLDVVKQKVIAAASLIEQEGEAAFPKLKDPAGEFRFADGKGYVWVHSTDGIMLMHPVKPELEGTNMLQDKDSAGFPYIFAMNKLVEKSNEGWVVYMWPKPGKKLDEIKASFVKLAKKGSKQYVVGCGMYAASADYVKATFPRDTVYEQSNFNVN